MLTRSQLIWLFVLAVGDIALSATTYWALPDTVPLHWNWRGQVDRYGSPLELALVFPIAIVGTTSLLVLLPRIKQIGTPLQRSGKTYGQMAMVGIAAVVCIHGIVLLKAFGKPMDLPFWMLIIMSVMFIFLGNWMPKLRRNQIAGIRTPWTLKSDLVWERTHRIGGRLQVAHGVITLLATFLFPIWIALAVFLGGLLTFCGWTYVYSRRVYYETQTNAEVG